MFLVRDDAISFFDADNQVTSGKTYRSLQHFNENWLKSKYFRDCLRAAILECRKAHNFTRVAEDKVPNEEALEKLLDVFQDASKISIVFRDLVPESFGHHKRHVGTKEIEIQSYLRKVLEDEATTQYEEAHANLALWVTLAHELAHCAITAAYGKRYLTPITMVGTVKRGSLSRGFWHGEAGDFMEKILFGGRVMFSHSPGASAGKFKKAYLELNRTDHLRIPIGAMKTALQGDPVNFLPFHDSGLLVLEKPDEGDILTRAAFPSERPRREPSICGEDRLFCVGGSQNCVEDEAPESDITIPDTSVMHQ